LRQTKQSWLSALAFLAAVPGSVAAAADIIAITPAQQQAMGITVVPVSTFSAMSGSRLPGEIMVPVGQERVVSAAQPGLVDAVFLPPGRV
jgi:hypothetical protein